MSKNKSFPEQHLSLGALLRIPYQHLNREVYERLATNGHPEVRPAHSVVFRNILAGGSRITDMAEYAGMTKQSMAALVDYLARHNYVALTPDPTDGRAKLVVLTDRGREVQQMALDFSREVESRWAAAIGEEGMKDVRAGLQELLEHLNSGGPVADN